MWLNNNPVNFAFNGTSCGFNWTPRAVGGSVWVRAALAQILPVLGFHLQQARCPVWLVGSFCSVSRFKCWLEKKNKTKNKKQRFHLTLRKAAKAWKQCSWRSLLSYLCAATFPLVVTWKETMACVASSASRHRWCTHVWTHTNARLQVCNIYFFNWLKEQHFTGQMCVCSAAIRRNTFVVPFQSFCFFSCQIQACQF